MKSRRRRTLSALLAVLLLLLPALAGCAQGGGDQTETSGEKPRVIGEEDVIYYENPITLRVLTDELLRNPAADNQMDNIIEAFEQHHVNVSIVHETLPGGESERTAKLQQIRAEMTAGTGPDIFILSTRDDDRRDIEMLFPDVNAAMRGGAFADISAYYDTDAALDYLALETTVMEAGVVDGARYTLPLRYDFPVLYMIPDRVHQTGLDADDLVAGVTGMMDALARFENPELSNNAIFGLSEYSLIFFSDFADYDTGEILLSRDDLIDLMDSYTRFFMTASGAAMVSEEHLALYLRGNHWTDLDQGFSLASLSEAIPNAAICKAQDYDLEMYPVTGVDGKVVAQVSHFGAVSSDCRNPEVAYQFLREFLTQESQWEQNVVSEDLDYLDYNMVAAGYCVRSAKSAGPYFQSLQQRIDISSYGYYPGITREEFDMRKSALGALELTDEDVPVLDTYIDAARYPVPELEMKLDDAWIEAVMANSEEPDFESVADDFFNELSLHLKGS